MNLDLVGNSLDDFQPDAYDYYDDDPACHAPSEYVEACRLAREERKRRDRNELQDLWREEVQARKRERARLFQSRTRRPLSWTVEG